MEQQNRRTEAKTINFDPINHGGVAAAEKRISGGSGKYPQNGTVGTKKKKKKSKNKLNRTMAVRLAVLAGLLVVLIIVLIVSISATHNLKTKKYYEVEAGFNKEEITAALFLKKPVSGAEITADTEYDLGSVGEYEIKIQYKNKTYKSKLRVVDTVAPSADLHPLIASIGSNLKAYDFIGEIYDETSVSAVFERSIDTSTAGIKDVSIILTDEGGNSAVFTTSVYVINAVQSVVWEIGDKYPEVEDFLPGVSARFTEDISSLSITEPGTYHIGVLLGGYEYKVIMEAKDTIAPIASPAEGISVLCNQALPEASALVTDVIDRTKVTFSLKENYSTANPGIINVTVLVKDAGGNVTEVVVPVAVRLENADDVTPPVITVEPSEIEIGVGESIPFSQYISIADDFDGSIDVYDEARVVIDKTNFNNYLSGDYFVIITAVDSTGNISNARLNIKVKDLVVTEEMTYALADAVINKVIRENMTLEEKIRTIWEYCRSTSNMTYTDKSNKSNSYITEAYYGFKYKVGDCYTYYSIAAALFDRLNINYYTVQRVAGARTKHWWLLVDFGDGWYHVDPCYHMDYHLLRRSDGSYYYTFKLTDAELVIYTDHMETFHTNWKYYVFDKTNYPRTPILNSNGTYTYNPYTVEYTADTGGRIEGSATQSVYHGKSSTAVTAVAGSGYKFVRWSDGVTEATRTDTVYANAKYNAEFVRDGDVVYYDLVYSAGEGGRISGSARQRVVGGTYGATVYAVANDGYRFRRWSDGVTRASRTDLALGDLSVSAVFTKTGDQDSTFTVIYAADEGGTIEGEDVQQVKRGGSTTSVTAVASEGYRFIGWSDGKEEATRTDIPSDSMTLTALFEKEGEELPKYTVEYAASDGGVIEGESVQTIEDGDETSSVTAVASEGWHFVRWDDGNTNPTRSDYPKANVKYTAIFEEGEPPIEESEYTISYNASEGGSIEGESSQKVKKGESSSSVTAVASEGWHFVSWSDGNTEATRSDTASADAEYTAVFAIDEAE